MSGYEWRGSAVVAAVLGGAACILWSFLVSGDAGWSVGAWLPAFLLTWLGFATATSVTARRLSEAPLDDQEGSWAFATPVAAACLILAGQCVYTLIQQSWVLPLFAIVVLVVSLRGAYRITRGLWWPSEPADRTAPDEVDDGRGSI